MVGWTAFLLGVFIVITAAYKQLGPIYCIQVAFAWHTLLMRSAKKKRKKS